MTSGGRATTSLATPPSRRAGLRLQESTRSAAWRPSRSHRSPSRMRFPKLFHRLWWTQALHS
eukprot:13559940-Alexandrium_andersonii.AAC.1